MIINCDEVSKRYGQHWIIKKMSYSFDPGIIYGIKGANGSGKSTLLKMLSGFLSPTLGTITYVNDGQGVARDQIFKHVSVWGPHTQLPGVLSIGEIIEYYGKMKGYNDSQSVEAIYKLSQLSLSINQRVDQLSSGQAQRLGLTMALYANAKIVLLDEPGSYLDRHARRWMQDVISATSNDDRILIIASNEESDLVQARAMIEL